MTNFSLPIQVRWSDLDPIFHVRHSAYYDWGSLCRVAYFEKYGLTTELMQKLGFGPILFREECVFKREIRLSDPVTISIEIASSRKDYSRWSIRHTIMKNDETIGAIITIDGAFMDMKLRKLMVPPPEATNVFSQIPLSHDFIWTG